MSLPVGNHLNGLLCISSFFLFCLGKPSPQSICPSGSLIDNDRVAYDGKLPCSNRDFCSFFFSSNGNPICQCGSRRHQIGQHRAVLSNVQKRHTLWIGRYTLQHCFTRHPGGPGSSQGTLMVPTNTDHSIQVSLRGIHQENPQQARVAVSIMAIHLGQA